MARRHPLRPRRQRTKPAMQAVLALLKKLGLGDQARRLRICAAWNMAVGPEIACRTEPLSFRRGVLTVRSASAAWQNELTFLKEDIIARVNEALGGKTAAVRELRVVGGKVVPRQETPEPPPAWVTAAPSADDLDVAKDAGQAISDPELRRIFEKALLIERRRRRHLG